MAIEHKLRLTWNGATATDLYMLLEKNNTSLYHNDWEIRVYGDRVWANRHAKHYGIKVPKKYVHDKYRNDKYLKNYLLLKKK